VKNKILRFSDNLYNLTTIPTYGSELSLKQENTIYFFYINARKEKLLGMF